MTITIEEDLSEVNVSTDPKIAKPARRMRDPLKDTVLFLQRVTIFPISATTEMRNRDIDYMQELANPVTRLVDETDIDWLDLDENTSVAGLFSEYVNSLVEDLLLSAQGRGDDYLEDGEFENDLTRALGAFNSPVIFAMANLLIREVVDFEVAEEVLQFLGNVDHPPSHKNRLWLLQQCLNATSPWLRDGATMGLSWLRDQSASDHLKAAIDKEEYDEIRNSMKKVLKQIQRFG